MTEPYEIKVQVDRSQAHQAADAAVADLKRIEDEAKRAATAEEQIGQQQRSSLQRTSQQRINAAADAGQAELGYQQQVRATGAAHEDAGRRGQQSMAMIGAATAGTQIALAKLADLARAFGEAMKESYEKSREYAGKFLADADRFRELAFLTGREPGTQIAIQEARFAAATGTRADEALAFRTQFQYRGAGAIGKTITPAQAEALQRQAALLAVAKGQDIGAAGEIAGLMAGQLGDIRGRGETAAAQAVLMQQMRGTAILSRGAGAPGQLLPQWRELMSTGLTRGPEEAATMISLMAEYNPAEASVYARRAIEGLRETKGAPAKFLKKAGVTPDMTPLQAAQKLRAQVELRKQAIGPGADTLTALKDMGFEERQAIGIQQLVDKGEKVFRDRREVGAKITVQSVERDIQSALANEAVRDRQQEADQRLAELERGAQGADVERLRRQAITEMTRTGELDTTDPLVQQYLMGRISFGVLGTQAQRIDLKAGQMLKQRMPAGLLGDAAKMREWQANTTGFGNLLPEGRSASLQYRMGMVRQSGGDPLAALGPKLDRIGDNQQKQLHAPIPPRPVAGARRAVGPGG